jgi:hypothetical protein
VSGENRGSGANGAVEPMLFFKFSIYNTFSSVISG